MMENANVLDLSNRPRRVRHVSGKNYDGEGDRSLELRGVLDVLSAYEDYEGGINCCMCGKLYKSKVCFIKHLWEHTVYWDLFPGSKNHERVLAIQAAVILYAGHMGISVEDAERLMGLLVTSPHAETATPVTTTPKHVTNPTTPKHTTLDRQFQTIGVHGALCPLTPEKQLSNLSSKSCPRTPQKVGKNRLSNTHENVNPATPKKCKKRSLLPKLDKIPRKRLRLDQD